MFDGSYRSKPRAVNLGTNRNRKNSGGANNTGSDSNNRKRQNNSRSNGNNSSTPLTLSSSTAAAATTNQLSTNHNSSRDSILNEAHRLRVERYQKLQYNKAAIQVQRQVRGQQLRKQLLHSLYQRIIGYSQTSSSVVCGFNMNIESTNTTRSAADVDVDTNMMTTCDDVDLNVQQQQQPDISTLLNIYLRLQQRHPQAQESNQNVQQQPILQLLRQFSTHIQVHHCPKMRSSDDDVDRTRKLLRWIGGMTSIIYNDLVIDDKETDFVLQVRPNTYHIFKSILKLIPTLFVRQRALIVAPTTTTTSSSSSWSSEMISTNDIVIIMSYIMQLHQYPSKHVKNEPQGEHIKSAMSIGNCTTILQMMISSLTSTIDATGRERGNTDNDSKEVLNDDQRDLLMLRMFLTSCIATFIANQPNMKEWCRPIRAVVLLIYGSFHSVNLHDIERSGLSMFRYYIPDIMKVLRPIPPPPISRRSTGMTTSNINGVVGSSKLKDNEIDENSKKFVTQMVIQLISQYRIPFLLFVSRAMSGEIEGSMCEAQNDGPFQRHNATDIHEQHRTGEQNEIVFLSFCVQFLKFLLLDSTAPTDDGNQYQPQKLTGIDDHSHFLLWMIQCTVRGDNSSREEEQFSDSNPTAVVNIASDGMQDNDEDTDQYHQESAALHLAQTMNTPATSISTATALSPSLNPPRRRLTKLDLQTLPKLDKKFADVLKNIDHLVASNALKKSANTDTLKILAKQICDPIAWLRWGNLLLSSITDMGDDFYIVENDMEYKIIARHGQDDYVALLVIFLQATTSLRTQQNALSSPFLKVIPFSSIYISNLWKYILRQSQISKYLERTTTKDISLVPQSFLSYDDALEGLYRSMSLFSDLFAHHLIAISDEQFVTLYTKSRASIAGDDEPTILVDDVIIRIRTVLNELYWIKPVCANDLKVILSPGLCHYIRSRSTNLALLIAQSNEYCIPFVRARLLLSGTKLYNALYERWCRSVTYAPFCDESIWWFPAIQSFTVVDNLITQGESIESTATERVTFAHHQQQGQRDVMSRLSRIEDNDSMDIDESSSDDENASNRPTIDEESDRLAAAFSDPKMARLLGAIPQVLPFDRRVKMFDSLIRIDKIQSQDEASDLQRILNAMIRGEDGDVPGRKSVKIRRDELYSDSMEQLNELGPKLKGRIHVSFKNQVGTDEAGIDGGGVFKEFIDDLIKDAFSVGATTAQQNLFSATPYQTLTVNIELLNDQTLLSHYEFLGRVLGKAVYESILVEAQFCLPFLNQILGKNNTIEDLKNLDSEYYTNLKKLLTMSKSDIESLCLTFELTIASNSTVTTIELIPNGGNISVSKTNVVQYVLLVSHYRLNVLTLHQTRAFLRGFRDLIPASWVCLFSAHELQKVISGDDSIRGIDVPALKKVIQYAAGYHPSQSVIEWFWEIVEEMTPDQQRKFLKFMTSCSRQPLLGFGSLEPAPCIQQIRLPDALFSHNDETIIKEAPLPTSSTCMNLFKLPNYHSKEIMRRKILAAIESGAGFELT